jgi:glutathione S-transferase
MSWAVWATAALEPASALSGQTFNFKPGAWGFGFGKLDEELDLLEGAIEGSGFVAGDRFTAADVMVGAVVAMRLFTGEIPARKALAEYSDRNRARPAFKRAEQINWPPSIFPPRDD